MTQVIRDNNTSVLIPRTVYGTLFVDRFFEYLSMYIKNIFL